MSGFARLLMGSVGTEVVQHSASAVVIVPHERVTGAPGHGRAA